MTEPQLTGRVLHYGPEGKVLPDGHPHPKVESQRLVAKLWRVYRKHQKEKRSRVPFTF